jgi:hypothetical protein
MDIPESEPDMMAVLDFDVYVPDIYHTLPPDLSLDPCNEASIPLTWLFRCTWRCLNGRHAFTEVMSVLPKQLGCRIAILLMFRPPVSNK